MNSSDWKWQVSELHENTGIYGSFALVLAMTQMYSSWDSIYPEYHRVDIPNRSNKVHCMAYLEACNYSAHTWRVPRGRGLGSYKSGTK